MSHVVPIELEIKDLKALATACKQLGGELILNQKQYKWYGTWVGDYPLPPDFDKSSLGKCDHAIRFKGCSYEVGVKKVAGKKSYRLEYDFWRAGGLERKIGTKALPIKVAYTVEATKNHAKQNRHKIAGIKKLDDRTRITINV